MLKTLTATILREDDGFFAICSELDIASQGETVEEARENLREAVELFFEAAHPNEIRQRLNSEIYITMQKAIETSTITVPVPLHSEIRIGTLMSIIRQSGIPRSEFE